MAIVSYTLFGLDALGDDLAAPFGRDPNSLPLGAMARAGDVTIRELLGGSDLPDDVRPVGAVLL